MESFIAAAVIGIVVGICSGLLGIGGGTLMVPIFRIGFSMSALSATATSLFTIVPTSLVGCITHFKNKTCIPVLGALCGVAGACLSPVGVYLANRSPSWLVMLVAALIIGYSSYTMFKKALRMPKQKESAPAAGSASSSGESSGEAGVSSAVRELPPAPSFKLVRKNVFIALGVGMVAGLASGYVGVGGGFIMVPLFVSLLGVDMHYASGTSLVAVTILAIPGVIEQGLLGNIWYLEGIAMAIGSIPGAVVGANLIKRVPERTLRLLFGCFLLVAAIVLVANEFSAVL